MPDLSLIINVNLKMKFNLIFSTIFINYMNLRNKRRKERYEYFINNNNGQWDVKKQLNIK